MVDGLLAEAEKALLEALEEGRMSAAQRVRDLITLRSRLGGADRGGRAARRPGLPLASSTPRAARPPLAAAATPRGARTAAGAASAGQPEVLPRAARHDQTGLTLISCAAPPGCGPRPAPARPSPLRSPPRRL